MSRRGFVGLASSAAAGSWFTFSNYPGARFVRQALEETTRAITAPTMKPTPGAWSPGKVTATWLGHATVLLNFHGITILMDPVLGSRVGAKLGGATIGPKRLVAPPLSASELPPIDLVLLSHAHMDHFDLPTLRRIPGTPKTVTAPATQDLLRTTPLHAGARELRWGESALVTTAHGDVQVTAFEVKHWGARWRHDRQRGYNGYLLERDGKRILFGGDTAMTDKFELVRGRKSFDFGIMPIGSYKPFAKNHCTPEESVTMANAARCDRVLPIHFKTFRLGEEGPVEPLERFEAAIGADRVALRDIGETFQLS